MQRANAEVGPEPSLLLGKGPWCPCLQLLVEAHSCLPHKGFWGFPKCHTQNHMKFLNISVLQSDEENKNHHIGISYLAFKALNSF